MPNIGARELTAFAIAAYEAAGTPTEHARTVAAHQVGANLVALLARCGPAPNLRRPHRPWLHGAWARPEVLNESPTTLAVNGRWGFGPVISEWTMERLIAKACEAH